MRPKGYVEHGKFGYREPEGAITPEYITKVASKIKPGDKITWMLPAVDHDSTTLMTKLKKTKLTVTGKTPHLVITEDASGRMHTIRIAELTLEQWKKTCRKEQK